MPVRPSTEGAGGRTRMRASRYRPSLYGAQTAPSTIDNPSGVTITARRDESGAPVGRSDSTNAQRSSGVMNDSYIRTNVAASLTGMLKPLASTVSGYATIVETARRSAESTDALRRARNSEAAVRFTGRLAGACAAAMAAVAATAAAAIRVLACGCMLVVLFL